MSLNPIQIVSNLDRPKNELLQLKKIEIKYGYEALE
jgi:hypothetical protein